MSINDTAMHVKNYVWRRVQESNPLPLTERLLSRQLDTIVLPSMAVNAGIEPTTPEGATD